MPKVFLRVLLSFMMLLCDDTSMSPFHVFRFMELPMMVLLPEELKNTPLSLFETTLLLAILLKRMINAVFAVERGGC